MDSDVKVVGQIYGRSRSIARNECHMPIANLRHRCNARKKMQRFAYIQFLSGDRIHNSTYPKKQQFGKFCCVCVCVCVLIFSISSILDYTHHTLHHTLHAYDGIWHIAIIPTAYADRDFTILHAHSKPQQQQQSATRSQNLFHFIYSHTFSLFFSLLSLATFCFFFLVFCSVVFYMSIELEYGNSK